jgi:hypothetical protein
MTIYIKKFSSRLFQTVMDTIYIENRAHTQMYNRRTGGDSCGGGGGGKGRGGGGEVVEVGLRLPGQASLTLLLTSLYLGVRLR